MNKTHDYVHRYLGGGTGRRRQRWVTAARLPWTPRGGSRSEAGLGTLGDLGYPLMVRQLPNDEEVLVRGDYRLGSDPTRFAQTAGS